MCIKCISNGEKQLYFRETLEAEEKTEASILRNPANFGELFDRQCICEIPGQVACPGWQPLPKLMRGKYKTKVHLEEMTLDELKEESGTEYQEWIEGENQRKFQL